MNLDLTDREKAFRDELRAWLSTNLPRGWKKEYANAPDLHQRFDILRRWQRTVYDGGWAGVSWPQEYGGRGASIMEEVIFQEEMSRCEAPSMAGVLGLTMIGPTIIAQGTPEQKRRFLAKILSGEEIWIQGFSEPNAGSDVAALRSEAKIDGDHFIVNGHKVWTSWGYAADWCALVVRTDDQAPKHKGLSYLLVDMHLPGASVRPLRQITGESEFTELYFENVRVPKDCLLGKLNDGWNVALNTLMHERNTYGSTMPVVFRRQLNRLFQIAKATDKDQDPVIRQKLAQCHIELEVFRLTQMRALSRVNAHGVPGPEGSVLKLLWSEFNQRMEQIAMELLGPFAQLEGGPHAIDSGEWSHSYLRSRASTIAAGTSEIQRNIVGHNVLGLPKSY